MKTHPKPAKRKDIRPRWRGLTLVAALVAALSANQALAQAPAAPASVAAPYSAQELENLVSRIALYPDDLVAIILPASINPLQIVQADRFLEKRKADPKAPVDEKWDDAVKSLLNYPEIIKTMSSDLDWTADLGEAVVTDQGAVLDSIQAFRRKTQAAGHLKSDDKQTVVVEKEVIKIVPANPEVIYVPQYNPSTVVVSGGYSYYPAPYPSYYYPYAPGAAFATGLIWGAAIGAAWRGSYYNTNWGGAGGGNTINIDNSRSFQGGDRTRTGGDRTRPSGGGSQWKPNKQPGQVGSSVGRQPSGGRAGDRGRPSTQPGGGRDFGGAGGGARPSQQPAGGRDFGGGRDGGGAFGGAGSSGRDARMDSSRGASSRDSMGSRGGGGGARASGGGGGGGARAGGGGGGRGGGGGGRGGGRR
jgi:hypothetical protein